MLNSLETEVLLARRDREICIETADCLVSSGIKVIEVANIDEALSCLKCRSDIQLQKSTCPAGLSGLDLADFEVPPPTR
ncbi:hypothetical protein JKG68_16140 [Microvirga aerilata]|uniref:Uncharacterized protein n=1 Tax=Microvirga aerilata TaxID=670292 RepID=A0A936ZGL6_9HYPH|nr:hypothetical protein [Microvirga aerilata]MBL0405500.1 hypothetical protein [Microvirga aerilata]